jgi:hypothetical protein
MGTDLVVRTIERVINGRYLSGNVSEHAGIPSGD